MNITEGTVKIYLFRLFHKLVYGTGLNWHAAEFPT